MKRCFLKINLNQFYYRNISKKLLISEYLRLWKLVGLFLVVSFLSIGSILFHLSDWDIPISILMPLFTYFLSPVSLWLILDLKHNISFIKIFKVCLSMFLCWICIDFIYCHYNDYYHHHYYRESNFLASFILYWLSAFFLAYCGNFKELKRDIQSIQFIK